MALVYTNEQRKLIDETPVDNDILIVAGAGSGKTFTMTHRILHLLEQGRDEHGHVIDPGSILGLTFTNKAAGELDRRVRTAVQQQQARHMANQSSATRQQSTMEASADRPTISTYDSFFQRIVREYGLLIGIDPQTQPLSSGGLHELASRVVSEKMGDILADFRRQDPLLPDITPQMDNFATLVSEVISLSSQILSYMIDEHRLTFEQAISDATKWNDAFRDMCAEALTELEDVTQTKTGGAVDPAEVLAEYFEDSGKFEQGISIPKSTSGKVTKASQKKIERYHIQLFSRKIGRITKLYVVARKRAMILRLSKDFQRLKRAESMADFADFTAYALQLVCRFPSIGERYRRQFRFVFLDEYQDTSTTQAKLIAELFHPHETNTSHDSNSPNASHRSVTTAVGDPFQSIYGWRGASPSAFSLFARDFGLTGDPATLSMTHRNKDLVLSLANTLTNSLRHPELLGRSEGPIGDLKDPTNREGDVPVRPLRPLRMPEDDINPPTPATVSAVGFSTAAQEQRAVAVWAREHVERLRKEQADSHADAHASSHADSPATPREPLVAVLLRSKTHMNEYVSALEDEGLDVRVVGLDNILDEPEVRDLMAVLTCVSDHSAVPSLMRLLATPRYGFESSDLQALSHAAQQLNEQKQYISLVTAGLATGQEDDAQRAALIREHRDSLPVLSTLIDLLLADSIPEDLFAPLTPSARAALSSVSHVLRDTEAAQSQGLTATLEQACRSLGLDTDVALAHVVKHPDEAPVPLASSRVHTQAVMSLVDTYLSELLDTSSATLRGFVSWVRDQDTDLSPVAPVSQEADVVVMTIHQAKGLEWPAVAIASMTKRNFPSDQSLTLATDVDPLRAVSHTWAEDPGSIPDPVRSDAAILPPFPHMARPGSDPMKSLTLLSDPADLAEEVFAPSKKQLTIGTRGEDYPAWLSLQEQYGKRTHAEERRLAYVAVTRSSGDVLLSYYGHKSKDMTVDPAAAGIFWTQAHDFLRDQKDKQADQGDHGDHSDRNIPHTPSVLVTEQECPDATASGSQTCTADEQMIGASYGPHAADDMTLFARDVPATTRAQEDENADPLLGQLLWPARVPRKAMRVLAQSAQLVSERISRDVENNTENDSQAGSDSAISSADSSDTSDSQAVAVHPLTDRARELIARDQRQKQQQEALQPTVTVTEAARAALRNRPISTTTLQKLTSSPQSTVRQIVRPMPQPPNEVASLGTLFHNWVATLLDPETEEPLTAGIPQREDVEATIADLQGSGEARRFARWQNAFENSRWSRRLVVAVERPYDMALAGHRIPARLDAVFAGGVDDEPGAERDGWYTIVDWKTGRPPMNRDQRAVRLLQLDLYRIAFSRARGVPMDHVEACLFYVNAPAGKRQINSNAHRSEEEIVSAVMNNPAIRAVLADDIDDDTDVDNHAD